MARGKKTGGRDWPKGFCPNPKGGPRIPEEVKQARRLNTNEMVLAFNRLMHMTGDELEAHFKKADTTQFEKIIAMILRKAETEGDHHRLNFFLDRLIGKVSEKVQLSKIDPAQEKANAERQSIVSSMTDAELDAYEEKK